MWLRSLVTPGSKCADFSLGTVDERSCRSEGGALCRACFGVYRCMRNGSSCQGSCDAAAARPRRPSMELRRVYCVAKPQCQRQTLCALLPMSLPWSPTSLGELRSGCGPRPFYQCSLRALWSLLELSSGLGKLFSLPAPQSWIELMSAGPTFSSAL